MSLLSQRFDPAPGLHNPHVQTVLSSMGRKMLKPQHQLAFQQQSSRELIDIDGVKLAVDLNLRDSAPLIIIVPGWLGSSKSSYVLSCGTELYTQGFAVARLNLRDHGETAHLNEGMFNSALIEEVVNTVDHLRKRYGNAGCGLVGYSLGGNFALRINRAIAEIPTLAVCPAIEPASTMYRIDRSGIYQSYFVRKWRKVWREKQAAFPHSYNFEDALRLNTVSALTDYFVRYHSDFVSTDEYFAAYDLSADALNGVNAHILAAADDPIIPARQYAALPSSVRLHMTERGGHGAYLDSWRLSSWADRYAHSYFSDQLLTS